MRSKILIGLICLCLTGCITTSRLTKETIYPGNPSMIVVEFPLGVKKADVKVVEIEGYAEAVAPVPSVLATIPTPTPITSK